MKWLLPSLLVFSAAPHAIDAAEAVNLLADGSLAAWDLPDPNPFWKLEGGVLTGSSDPAKKGNVLPTKASYTDVAVETEVKWTGEIDSGIFLRKGSRWQCQFGVSRSLKKDMTCSIYIPGKGYVVKADIPEGLFKENDWNKVRIEATGDKYRIWLNEKQVVDTELPGFSEAGPVALQIHPGVAMQVQFRNLTVTPLP